MTVQGVAGPRWLLRLLLVVGLGMLVAVLTVLWSAPSAHATPDPDAAATAATASLTGLVGDIAASGATGADGGAVTTATEAVAEGEPVAPAAETAVEPVPEAAAPVAETFVVPVVESLATPVTETPVAPVAESVAPVAETPGPVVEVGAPVAESVTTVLGPVAEVATAATSGLGPVAGALTASLPPVPDAPRLVGSPRHGMAPAPRAPVVAVAAPLPCPTVAAAVVPTVRPSSPWHPGTSHDDAPRPDDRLPVVAPPPGAEHVRSGTADHPRPTGRPAAGLSTPSAGTSSGARSCVDGDLPADLEPPQLRVLSVRAGPGAEPAVAPQIEILDSPA
ncbi:hypothetical protein [Cellulomonas terrae]|uniref:Uncharacterized protein n=1 Tax=Cellulomonas terrae TaxID=311234 RepID=A0A511JFT1_9CELL|nr:hypothetical protein [Cellulomonas terrae]GEL96795.1 hypothetical protein CTE05_03420 [Cellulomonas terrae]